MKLLKSGDDTEWTCYVDMSHLSSQEGVKTIGGGDIMNPRLRSMQLQSIRAEALMLRGAEAKKQQEMERIKLEVRRINKNPLGFEH